MNNVVAYVYKNGNKYNGMIGVKIEDNTNAPTIMSGEQMIDDHDTVIYGVINRQSRYSVTNVLFNDTKESTIAETLDIINTTFN